jgi:hypothetical protein
MPGTRQYDPTKRPVVTNQVRVHEHPGAPPADKTGYQTTFGEHESPTFKEKAKEVWEDVKESASELVVACISSCSR